MYLASTGPVARQSFDLREMEDVVDDLEQRAAEGEAGFGQRAEISTLVQFRNLLALPRE